MITLDRLGWCSFFEDQQSPGSDPSLVPARVLEDMGQVCRVHTGDVELSAHVSGKLRHDAVSQETLPVAGDFVLVRRPAGSENAVIVRVLRRRTHLARKTAGRGTVRQVLAANIDTVLVVQALDADFNPRRLERYLVAVREGGARPVVLLNKVDLCPDAEERLLLARSVASDAPVHVLGALSGMGLDAVRSYFREGETVVLVGSSGVGKSTLLNRLAGAELQRVAAVRQADGRGMHTTSGRRLVVLDCGGLILDTPGMRELGLLDAEGGFGATFDDVLDLARGCRFGDCAHGTEPGCAVRAAIEEGVLDPARLENLRKLEGEALHAAVKVDARLRSEQTSEWKRAHRDLRRIYREKKKG